MPLLVSHNQRLALENRHLCDHGQFDSQSFLFLLGKLLLRLTLLALLGLTLLRLIRLIQLGLLLLGLLLLGLILLGLLLQGLGNATWCYMGGRLVTMTVRYVKKNVTH